MERDNVFLLLVILSSALMLVGSVTAVEVTVPARDDFERVHSDLRFVAKLVEAGTTAELP